MQAINSVYINDFVDAVYTSRHGGVSLKPYDSFNLAMHVGDKNSCVEQNRQILCEHFEKKHLVFMEQVHGNNVVFIDKNNMYANVQADAIVTTRADVVLNVMTADCLPLLLASEDCVAAIHCGWRSLAANIVEHSIACIRTHSNSVISAFIGPCILQDSFEVGQIVKTSFCQQDLSLEQYFKDKGEQKYYCDLNGICVAKLKKFNITAINNLYLDTYSQNQDFFSYRKEQQTGRMCCSISLKNNLNAL